MSKQPLFSVGEEVILCSKDYPEHNGEYYVHKVLDTGQHYICRLTGIQYTAISGIGYLLDQPVLHPHKNAEAYWSEGALRKKYPPSTESFKEMMSNLTKVTMSNRQ